MEIITEHRCVVCGRFGSDLHHVKTKKSGGTDDLWNLLPVCRWKHTWIHMQGLVKATVKWPEIEIWLKDNNWELIEIFGRKQWKHY